MKIDPEAPPTFSALKSLIVGKGDVDQQCPCLVIAASPIPVISPFATAEVDFISTTSVVLIDGLPSVVKDFSGP